MNGWMRVCLFWGFGLSIMAPLSAQETDVPMFRDITRQAGIQFLHINGEKDVKNYIFEAKGGGLGFFDYDSDGWMDLWIVQGSTIERFREGDNPHGALFRNRKDGTFEEVTEQAGLTKGGWGMGVTFADFDNDGFVDIYLTNMGPNTLFRNNGDGTFSDVTGRAGVAGDSWSSSAAFGDYDRDGDLDLYVCNYISLDYANLPEPGSGGYCFYKGRAFLCGPRGLPGAPDVFYRNNGDGTFTDATKTAGLEDVDRLFGLGVVWADIDNDEDLDLYVANDDGPNLLYLNKGDGTFEELGFLSGLAVSNDGRNQGSMGVDIADYDNDGRLDAFVTHFAADYSTLYHNQGNLLFEDVTGQTPMMELGWNQVGWGTRFVDYNLDGWKDLIWVNGHVAPFMARSNTAEVYLQPVSFFINERGKNFRDASHDAGSDITQGLCARGAAFSDFDNDGDIDFAVANLNGNPVLFRTDRRDSNHWVMFRTRGHRSNRDGIGSRISIRVGEMEQVWEVKTGVSIYSGSDPRAHFGLGAAEEIDLVRIRWPSGTVQEFKDVKADRHYLIDEDTGLVPEPR